MIKRAGRHGGMTGVGMDEWAFTQWEFKAEGWLETEWLDAKVPGCVHTDLYRNGRIPPPFVGANEKELQWIDKSDWEYRCRFEVPAELLRESRLELRFLGLDTYAEVRLNGQPVLAADNMFRTWTAEVRDLVKPGENLLHIRFLSPVKVDLPKLERLGYGLPAVNDQSELGGLGDRRISVFARKAPYHYGWDWGPRFVTCGIWRPVVLAGWSDFRIRDLYIRQDEVNASRARLQAQLEVEAERMGRGRLTIRTGSMEWTRTVEIAAGRQTVAADLVIEEPSLWWCRGLGEPHLYDFEAELHLEGAGAPAQISVRTGLRSLKLVQEKDESGAGFCFELNGVPVFAKGANHIPNDSFLPEVTEERYRHEIATAAACHMNMLRVWGGGVYEEDVFYDLCDEYGILVWQDFMFSCSMYPGDEAFLENVRREAEDNAVRLRNHPCIALWCGNNEMDTAWSHYIEEKGWGWKQRYTAEQRERIWADYEALFHRLLPEVVDACMPGAAYWPSSPMIAWTNDAGQHHYITSTSGDIHYWGVWFHIEPLTNFNRYVGRFMSEYGFQSFPEYKTVRTYAEERDLELESEVMLAHQKHEGGNRKLRQHMELYMKPPKDFSSFLYMSQVLQGEAIQAAIEAHRRRKPYCMGTLYWQMNDCWPAASWSGMDYYGRWKALQYYTKRSFRDILVSVDSSGEGRLGFHIVSDVHRPVTARLRIELLNFDGELLREWTVPVAVPGHAALLAATLDEEAWLVGRDAASVVFHAALVEEGTSAVLDSKAYYPVYAKSMPLQPVQVDVTVSGSSESPVYTLTAGRLAKQVWLSAEADGVFTDNFFDVIPGKPVSVQFLARSSGSGDAFVPSSAGRLEVRSMADFTVLS